MVEPSLHWPQKDQFSSEPTDCTSTILSVVPTLSGLMGTRAGAGRQTGGYSSVPGETQCRLGPGCLEWLGSGYILKAESVGDANSWI